MSRTGQIALIVSICVNVFVLAAAGGGLFIVLHRQGGVAARAPAAAAARAPLAKAVVDLPRPQQLAFRKALRQARLANAGAVSAAIQDRAKLLQLLAAPQLDRAAIDQTLGQIRADDSAQRVAAETTVVDFAGQLNPADRAAFVQRLANVGTFRAPTPPAARNSAPATTDSPP